MIGAGWIAGGLLAWWVALDAATAKYNQCDNIAGTCLRQRQQAAIFMIQSTSLVLAIASSGIAWWAFRRRVPLAAVVGLAVVGAWCVSYLALDPISEFNNSRTGWLAR